MADADLRALSPLRDLERDSPTAASSALGHLGSFDGKGSEFYRPPALAFRL